jgi:nucleoside-diphosphate-sugar epimerase
MLSPSDSSSDLVTGATGMLGSHLAERLIAKGRKVRAIVRPGSSTAFLEHLGVEIEYGDLIDPTSCRRAVQGVDRVYHAAAKVGDWGPWRAFRSGCIDATRNLAEACLEARVGRLLHISSTSAYGHPTEGGPPIDESAPLGQNIWLLDPYTRSKVESEALLWNLSRDRGLPLTVIRPSWLFGERDRTTTPRLIAGLRRGRVPIVGPGDNPLSAIYAGIVADAAILAASAPASLGEAYNITSQGQITQREFLNLFARACGAPPVRIHRPYWLVFGLATLLEMWGRLLRQRNPPLITRYATWLLGRNLVYSTEKARTRLGWTPGQSYEEAIERTVRWFLSSEERNTSADNASQLNRSR